MHQQFSINQLGTALVEQMIANQEILRIGVSHLENGCRIIDAGIKHQGSLEAGRLIAEICMGGLSQVSLRADSSAPHWSWHIDVHSTLPVLACLGSQYAGWSLKHGSGKNSFQALGSGPARILGSSEPLLKELGYSDNANSAVIILEIDKYPPVEIADKIAKKCAVAHDQLSIILTPTSSFSGVVQVVARVLETALHKAHSLAFPIDKIIDGAGSAPLCPPSPNFIQAMGRTNDAILFAGQVHLFVDVDDEDAKQLAEQLPSSTSKNYGEPFADIFKAVNYDFYAIDPMLFSPAKVAVSSIKTGHSFHAGHIDLTLLDKSFF